MNKKQQEQYIKRLEDVVAEMEHTIKFIASQKDKTGNWAVEVCKRTIKNCEDICKGIG